MVALPQFLGEAPIEAMGCQQRGRFLIRLYLFEDEEGTVPTDPDLFIDAGADFVVASRWGGEMLARWAIGDSPADGLVTIGTASIVVNDATILGTYIEVDVPGTITAELPSGQWVYSWTVYYEDLPENGDVICCGPFRVNDHARAL